VAKAEDLQEYSFSYRVGTVGSLLQVCFSTPVFPGGNQPLNK
jgi:hypothetical protein